MNRLQEILDHGQEVFNHVPFPMMMTTREGIIKWWSREAEKIFGFRAAEVTDNFYPFIGESQSSLYKSTWDQVLHSVDPIRIEHLSLKKKDGESISVSLVLKALTFEHERYVFFLFDTGNFVHADEAFSTQELFSYKQGIDETFMLTHIDAEGFLIYANEQFLKKSKWTPKRVLGKSFWQMFPDKNGESVANSIWYELSKQKVYQGAVEKKTKDGETYWVDMTAIPVLSNSHEPLYYAILERDITDKQKLQTHLEQIAYIDPETGLMNRYRLESVVDQQIEEGKHFSLVYIDIDNYHALKSLHDVEADASLLNEFVKRVKRYFQDSVIARVGIDEFVVLTPLSDWFTQGFLPYLNQNPIYLQNKSIPISISGGIARFPEDQTTFQNLMKASHMTLLKVKREGGGNIVTLSKSDHIALSRKAKIEKRLIEALKHEDLHVVFQPQKNLSLGKIEVYETFVRWEDQQLGTISPEELIPIAEETGMIHDIGLFVLDQACKQAVKWQNEGKNYRVAVNTSIHEFKDKNMAKKINMVLETTNCPANLLQIEINESFALEAETEKSISSQMSLLEEQGVQFVLDDFGKGYGSFRYLQLLPIKQLKIDRSFISTIATNEKSLQLVKGMVQLGKSMEIEVVAEGVETSDQYDLLAEMKCDFVQGYLIGKPVEI
ncbi:bifunctional diguanylate cyclase/phosphodiesterase [Paenisporosarcina cavernae]|uniref:Bifunctional diguanylate cyclase/phosphodiesterase n=1 Tax=Paenisporosarcina cavernae TaxID=2320858 RepID=A0A385YSM9_9BACL|nr:bifunctional diguanylate cyclase/phosphodiesterase [Paenisporosarcina cavernae]AYC28678.1 bifunctional diguanylate cyclase/phosphodiesterase [Paenisporosarcina cavernae]